MLEGLAPVSGLNDLEALRAEHPCGCPTKGVLVIDDEETGTCPTTTTDFSAPPIRGPPQSLPSMSDLALTVNSEVAGGARSRSMGRVVTARCGP